MGNIERKITSPPPKKKEGLISLRLETLSFVLSFLLFSHGFPHFLLPTIDRNAVIELQLAI
jgi:hypothetical protein